MKINYNNVAWEELLYYDESSPSGLRWKIDIGLGFKKSYIKCPKDSVAGSLVTNRAKWWQVGYAGKNYYVHRVIWVLKHGSIESDKVIDHLDGNPLNNKIENLRLISNSLNKRNNKKYSCNKTGVNGVSLHEVSQGYLYYDAAVKSENKRYKKTFSVLKYGKEEAFSLACEWREAKIKELNEQGAGFTDRHGT